MMPYSKRTERLVKSLRKSDWTEHDIGLDDKSFLKKVWRTLLYLDIPWFVVLIACLFEIIKRDINSTILILLSLSVALPLLGFYRRWRIKEAVKEIEETSTN